MALISKIKKTLGVLAQDDVYTLLSDWQEKFQKAQQAYDGERGAMERRELLYFGTRTVNAAKRSGKAKAQDADYVRNIVFELIESQVDSSVPTPKVSPLHAYNEERAMGIEAALRAEIDRMPFERFNDEQERTTYIQGGSIFLVEWNNNLRTHSTVGEVQVQVLHPKQVIPQPGVTSLQKCEYVFVLLPQTKEYISRRFGVDVDGETEEAPDVAFSHKEQAASDRAVDTKVTLIQVYFRNPRGGIGRFSWVNDLPLEYMEDYQARYIEACVKCGAAKADSEECPVCGGKRFETQAHETEVLAEDYVIDPGVPGVREPVVILAGTEIPYYKPNCFPLVVRKNVSVYGRFLGDSDVDKIEDQQELVKKLGTKIQEKLLRGGSLLVTPQGASFPKTDAEFKIMQVKNAADASIVKQLTLQPNVSYDSAEKDKAYYDAKSTLGITDSYQGKPDSTATSGVAKQIAASQSAGRLESKRRMKDAAYADLYEMIFKFKLAYSDEPRPYMVTGPNGNRDYGEFDRMKFLEQDAAGQWYYNDQYLFSVDNSGGLANNRQSMWQETRLNLQNGAFGAPGELTSILLFWQIMESLHYPKAGDIRVQVEQMLQQQQQMMAQQQAMMQQQLLAAQAGTSGAAPQQTTAAPV